MLGYPECSLSSFRDIDRDQEEGMLHKGERVGGELHLGAGTAPWVCSV